MSFLKKTRRVHVTFGDYKRVINFPKDEEILDLRYHFHRGFSDVLSEDITPANVKFQRYDDAFQDYIDLENDAKLQENAKVKAIIPSKHGKKAASGRCPDVTETCCSHVGPHLVIPGYIINTAEPSDFKFHPIKKDVPYRLWNPVSNGLIQRDPSNPSIVTCSGAFGSDSANTVIQAKDVGQNLFYLVYVSNEVDLYITANGEGKEITVTPTSSADAQFEPDYYWGHTVFRSKPWNNLYLGCDQNKMATLVTMEDPHYPNPQAFFVVNKYNPILPPHN